VIEFNNFGVNRSTPAVGHNQTVESQHHAGVTFYLAGHVDLCDVPLHPSILVIALINNRRDEGIAYSRIHAGELSSKRIRTAVSSGTKKFGVDASEPVFAIATSVKTVPAAVANDGSANSLK